MKKRALALLLVICMVFQWLPVTASAASVLSSGKCGENATWQVTDDGTLTISGTGAIEDYEQSSEKPWDPYLGQITQLVIQDGITTIGAYAFSQCEGLKAVFIPASVTYIEEGAFSMNTNLEYFSVSPDNRHYLNDDNSVLYNKDKTTLIQAPSKGSLANYEIPDGVTAIAPFAFYACFANYVGIPSSVTSIGDYAFAYAELTWIRFTGSAPTFGDGVFTDLDTRVEYPGYNSTWTEDVMQDYGGTIDWVSRYDLQGSYGDSITWELDETGVLRVSGSGAMWDYNSSTDRPWHDYRELVTSVVIGEGITTIGMMAFVDFINMQSCELPGTMELIGDTSFSGCTSLKSIQLPDSVKKIDLWAFSECTSLTSIVIPASVTEIDRQVFVDSGLTEILFRGDAPQFGYSLGMSIALSNHNI